MKIPKIYCVNFIINFSGYSEIFVIYSVELSKIQEKKPCKYQETEACATNRNNQCNLWKEHVKTEGRLHSLVLGEMEIDSLRTSFITPHTSVATPCTSQNSP